MVISELPDIYKQKNKNVFQKSHKSWFFDEKKLSGNYDV